VAIYDTKWYLAQVEEEPPENKSKKFTQLKYCIWRLERQGQNQFLCGKVNDILKTINRDIFLKVDLPISISSR
jgi:hypothetical protein